MEGAFLAVSTKPFPLYRSPLRTAVGETIKIVVEDYVQHISGYHFRLRFDPEMNFGGRVQYQNRIAAEFNTLYHWHPLLPDSFSLPAANLSFDRFLFNNSLLVDVGVSGLVRAFGRQIAGRVSGGRNVPDYLRNVSVATLVQNRKMRFQGYNEYRKRFDLKPYASFLELTGDRVLAEELEALYGHVDAVEFYVGVLTEKPFPGSMFGEGILEMGAPFSLKGLMSNPICSPEYWKPSTFGGRVGFELVKSASLQRLICDNVKGCPRTAFHVLT